MTLRTGDKVILEASGPTGLPSEYKNGDVLTLGKMRDGLAPAFYIDDDSGYVVGSNWVRPYFELGERVRIAGAGTAPNGEYTLTLSNSFHFNDKTVAADSHNGDYWVRIDGVPRCISPRFVHKLSAPQFKIGDRVRISGNFRSERNGEFTLTAEKITFTGNVTDSDGDYWAGVGVCLGRPGKNGCTFELVVPTAHEECVGKAVRKIEPKKNPVVYRIEGREWFTGEKVTLNDGSVAVHCGAINADDWFDTKEAAIADLLESLSDS